MVFEQTAGRVKSVADRDVYILMRMMCRGITADGDLAPRYLQVDADPEQISLQPPRVPTLDDDAARNYAIKKALELRGPLADARRDRF